MQAKTLSQAKYYLRTKLGISAEYAEHTQECPWFGTGQGSGNSPFYWLLISSTLYDLYTAQSDGGATYASPDKNLNVIIHLLGFVDDVNNRTNIPPSIELNFGIYQVIHELIEQASRDSQLWHDIITAANQELELTKCKYHVIYYDFKENGEPIMVDSPDPPAPLQIHDRQGQPITIQHVQSSKSIKYLGCHKSPLNQHHQGAAIQRKCDDYARVINCSKLSRRGTQVFYQAIYRLSVNYPLPVCYFTEEDLNKLQRKAHTAMLRRMGYNQKTLLEAVFGPDYLGGAEFFHLYDEQGYGQLSHFMKFWRTPTSHPGRLLRIAISWSQYCVGIGQSVFTDTTTKFPHWEASWLSCLRAYLASIRATLELDDPYIPSLQQEHDEFIMDIVLASGKFKPVAIRMINYCRLYLRVITIADIANAAGTAIAPGMFEGAESSINRNSDWYHVHQQRPSARAWREWRKACKLFSTPQDHALHR